MEQFNWQNNVHNFDERRNISIPGDKQETITFCVKQLLQIGQEAIQQQGFFTIALSGGSTPNAIFKELSQPQYADQLDWTKVLCFWSDERSVPPNHPESNYHMAMQSGLGSLPIPQENIFRMEAEKDIEEGAKRYEELFIEKVPSRQFDLMMLGMGEDGHTASLFPRTHGLHTNDRLFIANYVPQKHTWRMSATYNSIHSSRIICIYVLGESKAEMVAKALTSPYDPDNLPVQRVGTTTHKAIWILDQYAASKLIEIMGW
jgi:6-phosphogluconolactonase